MLKSWRKTSRKPQSYKPAACGVFNPFRWITPHCINEGVTLNVFLLLLLAIIVFYPLFSVGFTTFDDAEIAINYGSGSGLWDAAVSAATGQGRFTFFWGYPALRLPHLIDNWPYYLSVKYGSFLMLLSALYYCVSRVFRSGWVATATLFFFLAFIQNGWDHNALTSYAFAFNFYVVLFLVSLGLFSTAVDRGNQGLAGVSAILYFFALGIEIFVLFFPFYMAVFLSRTASGESVLNSLKSGKKYIAPFVLTLVVYLTSYLAWRNLYPSHYDGNSLNGFDLLEAIKVVGAYSLTAFPVASLHFLGSPFHQSFFTDLSGLSEILSRLNAVNFIKPAVAGLLFTRLMTSEHFVAPRARTLLVGAGVVGIGIFLPNLLLGFVKKHQYWVSLGSYSYLYTYYSFISSVVFLALLAAYGNLKSRSWHPGQRRLLILAGCVVVMVVSFAVEVRNQYIVFDQKLSHRKWQLMDAVINSPAFVEIPDDSTIVAPTLSAARRRIGTRTPIDYWSKYTGYKTRKRIIFVDDKCRGGVPCYSLVFRQEAYSDNQFVVLSKMERPDSPSSSDLTIYSMPKQKNTVLVGSFAAGKGDSGLVINGVPVAATDAGLFAFALPRISDEGFVQTVRVTGNAEIFPDQITLSHYSVVPRFQ